jgi:hypothetical protein
MATQENNSNKDKDKTTEEYTVNNNNSSTTTKNSESSNPVSKAKGEIEIISNPALNPAPTVSNAIIPPSTPNPTPNQTIQKQNPSSNPNATGQPRDPKEKYPNTIIFYIESNLYSFNFMPQMLVPDVKSDTVFINPLVEYTKRGIRDIPQGAPKTNILKQFFIANEFEMMINRILSDVTSMQRKRTYKEAKDEGVVDENIALTVETLFKPNNVVYVAGKPYTIITHRYHKGDWDTDKKPSEQLVGISGDSEKGEKEADDELKELEKIDPTLLSGSSSARGLKVKNMLKQQQQQEQQQHQQQEEDQQQGLSAFAKTQIVSNKATLKKLPGFLNYLLGGDLRKNDPIGFEPPYSQMNPCEPITFTLVMGLTDNKFIDFVGDVDTNGETGAKLYENYVTAKEAFLGTSQHFFELISETIPEILEDYTNLTEEIKDKIDDDVNDKQIKTVILLLSSKKKEYMRKIKELSETLKQIFVGQQEYFKNVIALIKYIKTNYVKMIGYKKSSKALLADKCFDFDIQIFETLISSSTSMSQTIEAYKAKHLKWFDVDFTTDFEQDSNTINASNELDKYRKNQELMNIELRQFELYMLIIMFHCFTNQSDIWKIFLDGLPGFIKSIADETKGKMTVLQTELTSYNSFVSTLTLKSENKSDVDMIRDFAKRVSENESDYNLYDMSNKDGFLTKKNPVTEQEKRFIGLKEKEIEVYEGIILFTSLLELRCLRQFNLYASEQNMFTLQVEIARTFEYYYEAIEDIIEKAIGNQDFSFMIPKSIMWSTEDLNNLANKTTTDFIERKINSSERTKRLYQHKSDLIKDSIDLMEDYCATIHKMIDPVLDTDGLTNVCRNLQQGNNRNTTLIEDLLAFPDYETRLWQLKSIPKGQKNVELTDEFNSQMARVYRLFKTIETETINPDYKDNAYQDWVVLDDFPSNTNVDKMLKELNQNPASNIETLDRIRRLLSCELIIFEMKSEPNDKMDYSFNYETGVGMKGGWGFSKIEDIQDDFGLDCQGLNYSDGKQFLFLVKVTNAYKLVYNVSKKLIPANNYLYSYDTIHDDIKYVDNYIQMCDRGFVQQVKEQMDTIDAKIRAEEVNAVDELKNVETKLEEITDNINTLEEGSKEKAGLQTDLVTKLKEEGKRENEVAAIVEQLEDIKGVRRKVENEKQSELIYTNTKLQDRDISTIDDINQLDTMKIKIKANISRASHEMDRLAEDVRTLIGAKAINQAVKNQLAGHNLYNKNFLKKTANEAKLGEIDQRIQELEGMKGGYKPQVGGAGQSARDRYYLTQGIQGLNTGNYYGQPPAAFQQPYLQQPYLQQQPMSYGQQQPLYPSLNPFQRQRQPGQMPYGQQLINPLDQITYAKQMSYYNKALELESKLAFYVNVELTLFPGTSVNPLQKASALCSARFEDIRKAFTEIVGLEYRPRPLVDNTSYYNKDKKEERDNNRDNDKKVLDNDKKGLDNDKKRGGSIKNRKLKKNKSIRIKV